MLPILVEMYYIDNQLLMIFFQRHQKGIGGKTKQGSRVWITGGRSPASKLRPQN